MPDLPVPADAVDLTNCDREAIHLLGGIQPVGALVVLTPDWIVARVSANAEAWFGRTPDDLLGTNFARVVSAEGAHAIRNRLSVLRGDDAVERAFAVPLFGDARRYDVTAHLSDGRIILEVEPAAPTDDGGAGSLVRTLMQRLGRAPDFSGFGREAVRQMRALTGFDRVMLYRLHPDGSGEVIAETARSGMDPFLGLRYPATDIPKQARALYERNMLRLIADVGAAPVPVVPERDPEGRPLDLSMAVLRSVSPIHVEYLRNLGVVASMSVSVLRNGRLWGLFACHHDAPRHVTSERRTAAELFGQTFSLMLDGREREADRDYETGARRLHERIMAGMSSEASTFQNLSELTESIAELVPCDGVGVWVDGEATLHGATPTREEFSALVRFLNRAAVSAVYATNELGRHHEPARDHAERVAGVLAIPVSRSPRDYIVFFRREVARTVTWAGDPNKPVTAGPNGVRLTPRKSFAAWQEVVRGQSAAWTEAEVRVAESLRVTLLEVVLRLSDATDKLRRSAAERQELLIAELNHRVRNILGLIRGLVSQGRSDATTVEEFAGVLGGRVQALARAHDQITTDQWGPAPLRALVEAEAAAYLGLRADRLGMTGPEVLLRPEAFSTLALVIHELMTNSAKYGALSDSRGRIALDWSFDPGGRLVIGWEESGGPPVKAPTRRGFGSTVIERSIPHDLKGEAAVEYRLAGLRARLVIPASFVEVAAPRAPGRPAASPAAPPRARLEGDVLLVEDNMIIALDAEEMLGGLGARRVDVASDVTEALRIIAAAPPAFAVLDVNLGAETSFPVADRLRALGIPHVFATGYGEDAAFPPEHAGTPVVKKPYSADTLAVAIAGTARG